ncbi:MAG: cysteine desulfurase [candidate division Zixibacteria bacterium SM23_73]|nr:MAG: cysteine desulfurase [candidate division Zixibacteria bacterium SM23_73]
MNASQKRKIYLDHNATTPVHPEVLEAMLPYYKDKFGNASSIHDFGREVKVALEDSREKVAKLINASPNEIYFTSGGTESDNLAIKGTGFANRKKGKHIITSKIEHHAILESCKFLEKEGFEVTYLPVDKYGFIDPDDLKKAMRKDTILVSLMYANNEVGTIEPLEELCKITKEKGIYFHTDAVQAMGKISVDVQNLNVDLLSISAHKIYGPKGVGAIYIRKGTRITPWSHGGSHERARRAGTENVPSIVGLAKAVEIAYRDMEEQSKHLRNLSEAFYKKLAQAIPDVFLNGDLEKRIPNTLNLSFKAVEGESIILSLDLKGVAVSTGSACASGSLEPSHVLSAMGIAPEIAQAAIRFSFGRENTMEDVEYVVEILPEIVSRLRAMSPLYANK